MIYFETDLNGVRRTGEIETLELLELQEGEVIVKTVDLDVIVNYYVTDAEGYLVKEGSCPRGILKMQAGEGETVVEGVAPAMPEQPRILSYATMRAAEYPSITEQLDTIYHKGIDEWKAQIQEIKDKYPKGTSYNQE